VKRTVLGLTTAALIALPATAAPAGAAQLPDIPPINCGIVSCTYQIERKVDSVKECVDGAVVAVRYILQGTPQPQECSL
jgi:hypothetical protein